MAAEEEAEGAGQPTATGSAPTLADGARMSVRGSLPATRGSKMTQEQT
jgi:hypothetical protein